MTELTEGEKVKLTAAQKRYGERLVEHGFVEHQTGFGTSQSNRCGWALVNLGLAEFDWGPKGSFLQTQGFVPTEAGRRALSGEA
ncbi:hypothetical protein GCM10007276_12530 [Agaricicola taiwanensis]|uniref:Uncharacterized protein n=1 Tax=Agaricicola taiwanensis TaxID=591372 RepID=A0A8J2YEE6_9RHOB|nr:hypothetical protein [Agaricicola taiwanensis]GGE36530.1 hypothetical protein GCM10007276_12530 [Agaricicola taiwanensis]